MAGIIQRFLGLIEVQIFWRAALADQNNICPLGQFLQIQGIQKAAAFPMRLHRMSGHGFQNFLMLSQNHIDDKIDTAFYRECAAFS